MRTPLTRARKGAFKDTQPEEILAAALKAILDRTKIDPKLVDDIVVGNVLAPGGAATISRMAALYAGYGCLNARMLISQLSTHHLSLYRQPSMLFGTASLCCDCCSHSKRNH